MTGHPCQLRNYAYCVYKFKRSWSQSMIGYRNHHVEKLWTDSNYQQSVAVEYMSRPQALNSPPPHQGLQTSYAVTWKTLSFRPDENRNNAVPDAGTGVSEWLFSSTRIIKEGHIETMHSMRTRMPLDTDSLSFCRFLPKRATPALAQVNSVTWRLSTRQNHKHIFFDFTIVHISQKNELPKL